MLEDPGERVNLAGSSTQSNETASLVASFVQLVFGGAPRTSTARFADLRRRAPPDEGVDDVVLTPHYRPEDGLERAQQLQDYFEGFAVDVADAGIGVRVHLGAKASSLPTLSIVPRLLPPPGRYIAVLVPSGSCSSLSVASTSPTTRMNASFSLM